jgi:hypothetical protein
MITLVTYVTRRGTTDAFLLMSSCVCPAKAPEACQSTQIPAIDLLNYSQHFLLHDACVPSSPVPAVQPVLGQARPSWRGTAGHARSASSSKEPPGREDV